MSDGGWQQNDLIMMVNGAADTGSEAWCNNVSYIIHVYT